MKMPPPLSLHSIQQALTELPGWTGDEDGLQRSLRFATFGGAIRFMAACVKGIDQQDHHPVWTNTHSRLEIHLDSYDAGGKVTQCDVDLAHYLDSVLSALGTEFGYQGAADSGPAPGAE